MAVEESPIKLRRGRFLRLAIINGLLFAALLGACEIALRGLGWRPPTNYSNVRYENDPITGPWFLPSQSGFIQGVCFRNDDIHVNSFGMRDRERTLGAGGPRVALVGDSMLQGLQVRDDQVVSRKLEQLSGGRAEMLNFGVSSVGTSVELLNYRRRVRPFHPDTVLLLFALSNDVIDNLPALKMRLDPGMGAISPYLLLDDQGKLKDEPQPGLPYRTSRLLGWASTSVIGQWLHYTYQEMRRARIRKAAPAAPATSGEEAFREQAWQITEQVLLKFHDQVARDGAHFGLVIIPPSMGDIGQTGAVGADGQAAIRRLQAVAARGGFPALDLSAPFAARVQQSGPTAFSYPCDGHWNPEGHAIAAQAMFQFLKEQRWL